MHGITYHPRLKKQSISMMMAIVLVGARDMIPTPRLATSAMLSKSTWLKSSMSGRN